MTLGEELYRTRDADGVINVYQNGDRRSLCFGNAVEQSGMSLADPSLLLFNYTRAMMLGAVLAPNLRRTLVLGLGGGSLARALHAHFPHCRITAVELRAAVLDVARAWFALPDDDRLGVYVGDAAGYLAERRPSAGLIFADLYDSEGMHEQLLNPASFGLCRQALTGHGVAVFNLWSGRYFRDLAINDAIDAAFDNQVLRLAVPGRNRIVFGFADAVPELRRQDFRDLARQLGLRLGAPLLAAADQLWVQNPDLLRD